MSFNPLKVYTNKCDLDWTKGTLRIVEDGGLTIFLMEEENGEYLVLNIIKD
ncbi:hypothetical protein [Heyndrickxia camelliae]|uniref:hypothetical protein n=1 Tax=Heyndrickxia camelliae TaxID=1707093 RepID=UPI0013FD7150|nr:hypothetical protein [Heyndrickxia camelliae]